MADCFVERSHTSPGSHALSAIPKTIALTSIDDSPIVVEDYSALVQGRNCVQEVEGPQVPLRLQLRTSLLTSFRSLKSALNVITLHFKSPL